MIKIKPTYIHYGSDAFHKIKPVHEIYWNKPYGGFWASRINTERSWINFYNDEKMTSRDISKSFTFTLTDDAKILSIHDLSDIPKQYIKDFDPKNFIDESRDILDFDKIMKDYDGMELFLSDNFAELRTFVFYSWDCDSIVIWNDSVVQL